MTALCQSSTFGRRALTSGRANKNNRSNLMHRIRGKWALALATLLIPMSAARPQTPVKPLVIQDVFQLQLATDPQISPDGKRIVYVRQFNDIMTDQRCSNLWIINADGSDHRPLTTG